MFYEYAQLEDRQDRAIADIRMLDVLGSALGLLSKETASAFKQHREELLAQIKET
jgi:hypothetical protein